MRVSARARFLAIAAVWWMMPGLVIAQAAPTQLPGDDQTADSEEVTETPAEPANPQQPDADTTRAARQAHDVAPTSSELDDRAVLVETHTIGIDPVVGRFVNQQLRISMEAAGYRTDATERSREVMQSLSISYPPVIADLWRITNAAGADRGVFALVWAAVGRYVIQIQVASRDGTGPFYAQGEAGSEDLKKVVDELLHKALPGPGETWDQPTDELELERDSDKGRRFFDSEDAVPPRIRPRHRPFRLALHGDMAFGIADDSFQNGMLGARLDFRFNRRLALGGYLGYANLRGRDERVTSVLPYIQLENRVSIVPGSEIAIPLRIGLGYLVRNGLVLRLASGIAFPLSKRLDLVFDLLTPTFWLTRDRTLFSLDLAVELGWKL